MCAATRPVKFLAEALTVFYHIEERHTILSSILCKDYPKKDLVIIFPNSKTTFELCIISLFFMALCVQQQRFNTGESGNALKIHNFR